MNNQVFAWNYENLNLFVKTLMSLYEFEHGQFFEEFSNSTKIASTNIQAHLTMFLTLIEFGGFEQILLSLSKRIVMVVDKIILSYVCLVLPNSNKFPFIL